MVRIGLMVSAYDEEDVIRADETGVRRMTEEQ